MRAVAAGRRQRAGVEVDARSRELAAELRVLVVEILHGVPEPVAVPVHHHHVAVGPRELHHLLVHLRADLLRHDADRVADASDDLGPALGMPLDRELPLAKAHEVRGVAHKVLHAAAALLGHGLAAVADEGGVEVHPQREAAAGARAHGEGQQGLAGAAAHLDQQRAVLARPAELVAEAADEVRGVLGELREEALRAVRRGPPLLHAEAGPVLVGGPRRHRGPRWGPGERGGGAVSGGRPGLRGAEGVGAEAGRRAQAPPGGQGGRPDQHHCTRGPQERRLGPKEHRGSEQQNSSTKMA
mmetsp:Transcript_113724/g.308963  ORF Transcript_113724/g.308963 Transcript_113724/m.308963 type:complete len:299 (-) Transcript_113724:2-898(-)